MRHYAIQYTVRGVSKLECVQAYTSTGAVKKLLDGIGFRDKRFFRVGKIETLNLGR